MEPGAVDGGNANLHRSGRLSDGNGQTKIPYRIHRADERNRGKILNYDDKWVRSARRLVWGGGRRDPPPRLDTHGAVNLILTNGSHLTAGVGHRCKGGRHIFTVYAKAPMRAPWAG